MKRLVTAALLALLLVPTAAADAATRTQVLRDCVDDSMLQGTYTRAELTDALSSIPTDADMYGDCRDVLDRARLDLAGANRQGQSGKAAGTDGASVGSADDQALPPALRSGGAGTAGKALDGATAQEREAVARAAVAGRSAGVKLGGAVVRAPDAASSTPPLPLLIVGGLMLAGLLVGLGAAVRGRLGRTAKG